MADDQNGIPNTTQEQQSPSQLTGVTEPAAPVSPYGATAADPTTPVASSAPADQTMAGYDVPGTTPLPNPYPTQQPTTPLPNQQAPFASTMPPQPSTDPYQQAVNQAQAGAAAPVYQPQQPQSQQGMMLTQLTGSMKFGWLCIGLLMGIPGMLIAWLVNVDKHPQVKKDAILWSVIGFAVNFVFGIIFTMALTGAIVAAASSGGGYYGGGYYF